MKLPLLCLLFALLTTPPLYGAEPLTLDEALRISLKNHPQMVEARENLLGAEARTGQAVAHYYPQVSIVADWSKGRSFLTALEETKETEVYTGALYLKQTIYDFGRTSGAVDAARFNREAADKTLELTRQELSLRVKSAYYLLLATEKQVVATKETLKAREAVYTQAAEFFKQGIRAKVDAVKAEANFFAAKTILIRAENNRAIARIELANAMGMRSLDNRSLIEPPAVTEPLPEKPQVTYALHNRGELLQLAALKSAATANLRTSKSSFLPLLSGTAHVGYADKSLPPAGNVWGIGLNLTIPLFSGFSSVQQVREATAALNAVSARHDNLNLQVIKEVETAWLNVNEASARMVSTDMEVASANENQVLTEGRYHEGVGNIIEVTDAQSLALDAQTAHIQAVYDYYIALARLDRAIGQE